ncbi:MAG: caspase family protein, partial [Cyanobacteria bacterium]|nr:caspase family protein [Cyanobacteriota bacterium]
MARPDNQSNIYKRGRAKFWMLLIGVNEYDDPGLTNLSYAVADCTDVAKELDRITDGFHKEQLVHCAGREIPSKAAIMANLDRISQESQRDDMVLFYFSGHGHAHNGDTYLCLPATKLASPAPDSLLLSEFLACLRQCNARKQIVLVDACHSGAASKGVVIARSGDASSPVFAYQQPLSTQIEQAFDAYTSREGVGLFTLLSCRAGEFSYEFPDLGHGVFTYWLLDGLRGKAADRERRIKPGPLFEYVKTETIRWIQSKGLTQTPKRIIKDDAEDFPLGFAPGQHDQQIYEQTRQAQYNIYRQHYYDARQHGLPLRPEDEEVLKAAKQELRLLRHSDFTTIEADVDHVFQHCEGDITLYIQQQKLPIPKDCDPTLQTKCHKQLSLSNQQISVVYQRLAGVANQAFDDYHQQVEAWFLEHGAASDFSAISRANGLTDNNVGNSLEKWRAAAAQREANYRQGFAGLVAESWDEIDVHAYPEA